MGAEAKCEVRYKGKTTTGKVRLETDVLEFRANDLKLTVPFNQIEKVDASNGVLTVKHTGGTTRFALGAVAAKWADKIRNPPSRLAKIGVKPEWRVSVIGIADDAFLAELEDAVAHLSIGRVVKDSNAIFYGATKASELRRLEKLKASIKPDGAIWVIRPKGRPEISERAVMDAGRAAGLVDVKVVAFSPTHTAEKFVIPRAAR
jgi:hypothetical protein